jgi:hopene-associated glycosyltransferase HpnB
MGLALLALAVWLYLAFLHGRFWSSRPELPPADLRGLTATALPAVDVIVPARDEVATIAPVIASLLAQDYPGELKIILVDDSSTDGTATAAGRDPRLRIISGKPKPGGWSGKLWALSQGVAASNAPLMLFTDADIVHDPRHVASLVAHLLTARLNMVSEMVRLNCASLAERSLVPAFVYFFQMLYPFARVNDPQSAVAAAAGGTVLIRRPTLERLGGIAAIHEALIDDVSLARAAKRHGPIYLGHSGLAVSIRPYPHFSDIWQMIARTAFTQLRYSGLLLLLTVLGLTLVWLVPPWAMIRGWWHLFAAQRAESTPAAEWLQAGAGTLACLLAALSYQPTLRRYRRQPLWCTALPMIALFYMAATAGSACAHWFGRGASWKARAYRS